MRLLLLILCAASAFAQGTAITVNSWTKPSGGVRGWPVSFVGYDNLAEVSDLGAGGRECGWGYYHPEQSEKNEGIICFDMATKYWYVAEHGSVYHKDHTTEGGHEVGLMWYDTTRKVLGWFGGASGSNLYERPWQMYEWDAVGHTGRNKFSAVNPEPGAGTPLGNSVFDPVHNKVFIYQDKSETGNKISILTVSTNTWAQGTLTGTTPPNTLTNFGLAWNSNDGLIYLYGGVTGGGCGGTLSTDMYTIDPVTLVTTKLTTTNTPTGRFWMGFAYSSADNKFLIAGGANLAGCPAYPAINETWVFDPTNTTYTQKTPVVTPTFVGSGPDPFWKMAYNPTYNAFIMVISGSSSDYAIGSWNSFPAAVWIYCLSTCSNYGTSSPTYTPSAGSINVTSPQTATSQAYSSDAEIYTDFANSIIYYTWMETGPPLTATTVQFTHPYAKSLSGTTYANLTPSGSVDYTALDSESGSGGAGGNESCCTSGAVVNSVPWVSWSKWSANGVINSQIYAKQWTGSAWTGGTVGLRNNNSGVYQGFSALAAVSTTPHVAIIEWDNNAVASCTNNFAQSFAYVDSWNGSAWVTVGGKLNRKASCAGGTPTGPRTSSIAIASTGSQPIVAWTEYVQSDLYIVTPQSGLNSQMYVSSWSGAAWTALGGALNINTATWADMAAITYVSSTPYVAWTERTDTGVAKLYLASWNGAAWTLITGAALNKDASLGTAFRPRLKNDGTNVFVMWEEQTAGAVNKLYVSKWDGATLTAYAGAINKDATNGTVAYASLDMYNTLPIVAWTEATDGNLRQTYTAKWFGATWGDPASICTVSTSSLAAGISGTPYSQTLASSSCVAPVSWSVTVGSLPGGLSLAASTGVISGTPTTAGLSSFTVRVTDANSVTADQPLSITITDPIGSTHMVGGNFVTGSMVIK